MFIKINFFLFYLISLCFLQPAFTEALIKTPIIDKNIDKKLDKNVGPLPYEILNFKRGIYKKTMGPDHCIEGEYRLLKDPKTGRVFLNTPKGVLIDYMDQRVKNSTEKECSYTYFNLINDSNEFESTEVQSCTEPLLVSNIRTLKVKFEDNKIQYVFIAKDPLKNTSKKTNCELIKQN